ncbi:hypothetical protein MTR67_051855 [Solanum verrucosum]|uniref:RNase H type-1 domain-containing protein n=1 Tax=Solanum verrucosum TaxID=315347 RepID=A0AAF0V5X4_SOLVR|nr:hypothetical protein MTR67_051855 [Solanum verrucosum]
MLAQEIIHQIKKPTIGSNVLMKLDMAKAYDRVSWSYICLVLRKMEFDEVFIDMTWRIMTNNWYSIIINGKRYGFFHSTGGVGPLAQFIEDINRFNNDTISEFIEEGKWNINKIIQLAPLTQVHNILATQLQLQLQQGIPDQPVWNLNCNGLLQMRNSPVVAYNLQTFYAVIQQEWISLITFLMLEYLPKRGKQSNIARVKFLVLQDTFKLLHTVFPYITCPSSWMETVILIEKCFHETKVTLVLWMKPPDVWFKLNTDGSALDNPGSIGAGGILRNSKGNLIFDYYVPLLHGTNNQEEVEAVVFGLSWCVQLNYQKAVLQVDSQMLVD